jgi:hypothetical protein
VNRVTNLVDGIGWADRQASLVQRGQVDQVVAHEANLVRFQAQLAQQLPQRLTFLDQTLGHVGNLELGGSPIHDFGSPARENGRSLACSVPECEPQAVPDLKMFRFHTQVVYDDGAVSQDAIDVHGQELDRCAPGGQIGR